ncbi:MAG: valine--tRNA ligase [Candidatus Levybacteria bacterium]|nr:valine--tRNA ligase [Candidatus Levybacteria bacterium]
MDKVYNHKEIEEKIYKEWEEKRYFKPEINPNGKPYTIILPPPNANGALHFGHAMFTVEDILIRYHRMKGDAALWLPGTDHAGIETQFVFERKLKLEGKSRLDYDQETFYKMIWGYVEEHRGGIQNQLRKLGFSLDWSREKYTLDPAVIKLVYKTFKRMFDEGIAYRDYRLVNYCTRDGTSFSDLEVKQVEQKDPLYYLKYGPFVLATVRPETKFGDTAVAVNPNDKRYQKWIGREIEVEGLLGKFKLKVIADDVIDPNFGTGVAKVTPSIDMKDFEIGKRHNLPLKLIVGFDGKLTDIAGPYAGLYVKEARKKVVQDLQKKGLIEKIDDNYIHTIATCYKCGMTLEPLPKEQWFVKVKPLAQRAIEVVKKGEIKITPRNFENTYFQWLENLRDWNISRQIVWGIRIPAWRNKKTGEWVVTEGDIPSGNEWEQDTDTFDTWFSSGQWPYITLLTTKPGDFEKFYPTSVMETGYDILKAWVSRMMMMGIYATGKVPFRDIVLHGLVNDPYGKKMSKSKGNVVNPLELVEQYGADAVRFALMYGNATGNDQSLSYPKLDAARKFTNKLWNIGRFINMKRIYDLRFTIYDSRDELLKHAIHEKDREMVKRVEKLAKEITKDIDNYNFNFAAEKLYDFIWHMFADKYIEDVKTRIDENSCLVLTTLYLILLKLLHPFMPFVTEEIYKRLGGQESIMISKWPK